MTSRVHITYPVDALVSYHYYREDKHMQQVAGTGRLRLVGDSGAFSAATQGTPINIAEFAAWAHRWRDHLYWVAALDVIGDPAATLKNWRTLRDKYGLDTIPTVHLGTHPSAMDVYAKEGVDFIGLGGMVGKSQPAIMRWTVAMLRYARDNHPQMRFHGWGQAGRGFLDRVPVYSADSSGALGQSYRYGRLRLFDPGTHRDYSLALDGGTDVIKLGGVLRRHYGVDPADIRTSHPGNRTVLVQLAAASVQQYANWLQRRHKVTPPTYGINAPAVTGTRIHAVADNHNGPGNSSLERVIQAASADGTTGTRVHVVAGANQPPDILPVLDDRGGTRIHTVDTYPPHLAATVADKEPA